MCYHYNNHAFFFQFVYMCVCVCVYIIYVANTSFLITCSQTNPDQ